MTINRVNPGNWATNAKLKSTEINQLDTNVSHALDKTSAGDNIAGAITLSSGGSIDGYTSGVKMKVSVSGASIEATASGSKFKTTNGATFEIGDASTYPTFTSTRTRQIAFKHVPFGVYTNWNTTTSAVAATSTATGAELYIQIPTHSGAKMLTVSMYYYIATSHFPANLMSFEIIRHNTITGSSVNLYSLGAIPVNGSDAASYYGAGALQTLTLALDQNHTNIDPSIYTYYAHVVDESGSSSAAGNQIVGFKVNYTEIADMRFA